MKKAALLAILLCLVFMHIGNDASARSTKGYCPEQVSLSVIESSSILSESKEKWGPQNALSAISSSSTGFWHSNKGDFNPWLAVKMPDVNNVIVVKVTDRTDDFQNRFKNVEVSVGTSSSINSDSKISCGLKSYKGVASTTYRFYCPPDTVGEYIFIQKHGSEFLHVNHIQVLVRGNDCADAQQVELIRNIAIATQSTDGYCPEQASLSVIESSSILSENKEKWGPQNALSNVSSSSTGFWHSNNGDFNPWLAVKMPDVNNVIIVEVTDRMDNFQDRFKNVEVSVGNSSSINSDSKISCGLKSYKGVASTTYRFYCPPDTVGQNIFIQKHGSEFLHVNHMQVLVRGNGCASAQQVNSKSNTASDSSDNGLPDVGVVIECDKCDAFFDKHFGPNSEFEIKEDETKLVTDISDANGGTKVTSTYVDRDGHNINEHTVNVDLGNGDAQWEYSAGTKVIGTGERVYVGAQANANAGFLDDAITTGVNAGASYGISGSEHSDTPTHVVVDASVGISAGSQITDEVAVNVGFGVGAGLDVGYNPNERTGGLKGTTPVGTFGARFGCTNEVCIFACITITVC